MEMLKGFASCILVPVHIRRFAGFMVVRRIVALRVIIRFARFEVWRRVAVEGQRVCHTQISVASCRVVICVSSIRRM